MPLKQYQKHFLNQLATEVSTHKCSGEGVVIGSVSQFESISAPSFGYHRILTDFVHT